MNRTRTWEIITNARPGDRASLVFDVSLVVLILANVVAMIVESVASVERRAHGPFVWFEAASVAAFTVEYALRVWACAEDPRYADGWRGRARFAMTPLAVVDLLAVAPFYLPFLGLDLRVVRVFRLLRLARLLKLGRYTTALHLLARVLARRREELVMVGAFVVAMLLTASTLMYYAERDAQPEAFGSIPAAMWWTTTALTPLSQGGVDPVTGAGRALSACIAVLGLGLIALPTGIIGAGLVEEITTKNETPRRCSHCGAPFSGG